MKFDQTYMYVIGLQNMHVMSDNVQFSLKINYPVVVCFLCFFFFFFVVLNSVQSDTFDIQRCLRQECIHNHVHVHM